MNIVLLTGRAGSKSVENKNMFPILGEPLASYAMRAAGKSRKVDAIYISTDCEQLKELARAYHIEVIDRPPALARDDSELVDAVVHAMEVIDKDIKHLVTMHCNCGVHKDGLVDECIEVLEQDNSVDACVSGRIDNSVHPFRSRQVTPESCLAPWLEVPDGTSSNRQGLTSCFVLDGAARALRVERCFPPSGTPPFAYLGQKVRYVENPGPGDVHSLSDISATEFYLRNQ